MDLQNNKLRLLGFTCILIFFSHTDNYNYTPEDQCMKTLINN